MGQVTIYLDDDMEAKMRSAAKAMKMSQSKWISVIINEKVNAEWPITVREMAGAWKDFPNQEEIRSSMGRDAPREDL